MATNVQRLIVMTIAITIVIGLINGFYLASTYNYTSELSSYTVSLQNSTDSFWNTFMNTNPDTGNTYLEQQPGDAKIGATFVFNVLKGGIGINTAPNGADWIEIIIINCLNWVIHILDLLLGLEVFYMFYSKKVS